LEESGLSYDRYKEFTFYEGAGCEECHGTGYHGRSAIVELLNLNDQFRDLIVNKAPVFRLKKAARQAGTVFLREAALENVFKGISTLKEINRVTFVEQVDEA
jgi:type IV pilus assembly protein PilB